MHRRAKVPDNDIQSLKHENNVYHCKPHFYFMTCIMKPAFCLREKHTEAADQLCSNRQADHILCFRDIDSRVHKLAKSEISRYAILYLTDLFGNPNDAFFRDVAHIKAG